MRNSELNLIKETILEEKQFTKNTLYDNDLSVSFSGSQIKPENP
jgi:hypothetical protein